MLIQHMRDARVPFRLQRTRVPIPIEVTDVFEGPTLE